MDVDRVRARLSEAGLFLGSSADELPMRIRMVLEDHQSFGSYATLRRSLLNGVGVRSVVPIELERGRAVLEVDADQGPAELLDALLKAAPPTLQILPIRANGHTLVLYVAELAPEPEEIEGFDPGDDEPAGSWMPGVGAYDRGRGKRAPGVRRRPPRD